MKTANTTTTVTLRMAEGMQEVPAARVEGGLALHRDVKRPSFWAISHVPSGKWVWEECARAKIDAMVRFDALLALTDWDRPEEDIVGDTDLYFRIRDLQRNPPSAPRPERKPRPPIRVTKRARRNGEEFEVPVWWEEGGLTVEGDPKEVLVIAHDPSRLRVAALPRRTSRAKAARIAKAFLDLGKEHGVDWTQKNPFHSTGGVPQAFRRMVYEVEQGIF